MVRMLMFLAMLYTFVQSHSHLEGTRRGLSPVHAFFSSRSDIIIFPMALDGI